MKNTTEKTLAVFRPAKRTAVPSAALGVAALVAAFIAAKCGGMGALVAIVLALVGVSLLIQSVFRLICALLTHRYEVTTSRLVARTGFIVTHKTSVRLEDVRGVSETKGLWGALLGYSTLEVGTAATGSAELAFKDIANASEVMAIIEGSRE